MFDKYFKERTIELDWDYIMSLPEFQAMETCEQNPKWHKEGAAMEHTKKCLEVAYSILPAFKLEFIDDMRKYIMGVLMHDIGKPSCAIFKKGNWHHYGHEMASVRIIKELLPEDEADLIVKEVGYHMKLHHIYEQKDFIEELMRIMRDCDITLLLFIHECDVYGSEFSDKEEKLKDYCRFRTTEKICKKVKELFIPNEYLYRNKKS